MHVSVRVGEKIMALGITTVASVFIVNALIGSLAVMGVYKLMEASVALGAAGGAGVGVAVIVAEWQLGERLLVLTVSDMKILVVAAAIGAVVGIVGTLLAVKPEI
jgi:hypothetical protein